MTRSAPRTHGLEHVVARADLLSTLDDPHRGAAAHSFYLSSLAAFVISYILLKNKSASLKSGNTQTAPSADNRVARIPVPMPINGMQTLRQARASQTPSPTYTVQANDSPYRSAALCLESLIMDSRSRASSADAAGWSSKHIPALAILRRAESPQPPVASDTRCEPLCASRDNNLSAPATGANGDCDEAAASNWMKCWRNRETSCAVGDRPMRDVKTSSKMPESVVRG